MSFRRGKARKKSGNECCQKQSRGGKDSLESSHWKKQDKIRRVAQTLWKDLGRNPKEVCGKHHRRQNQEHDDQVRVVVEKSWKTGKDDETDLWEDRPKHEQHQQGRNSHFCSITVLTVDPTIRKVFRWAFQAGLGCFGPGRFVLQQEAGLLSIDP